MYRPSSCGTYYHARDTQGSKPGPSAGLGGGLFPMSMETAFTPSAAPSTTGSSAPRSGNDSLHVIPRGVTVETTPTPNVDALHALPSGAPAFAKNIRNRFKRRSNFLVHSNVEETTVVLSRGSKQYIYDEAGNEYLDCINGTSHVGHCHPQVVAAGQNQMARLTCSQGFVSDLLSRYVKELVNTLPESLSVAYLCNSGSEANDLAIRLARQYTGAEDIVAIEGSYHGNLSVLVDVSSRVHKSVPNFRAKDWVHQLELPNLYTGRHTKGYENAAEATQRYIDELDAQFAKMAANGRRIAAHISEPYLVIPGLYIPQREYIQALYRTVRKHGGVVIADEVQTGMGRTGENFWSFQNLGVVPDIVTIGRPMGNGYPMGAVICTQEISDKLGGYFSTFGGNPVSCAIGLAVMDVIYNEKLMSSAKSVGRLHGIGLNSIKSKYPEMLGDVRGQGLIWAMEIISDSKTREPCPDLAQLVMYGLKAQKILIAITGANRNILLFTPPLCFTVENSRRFCKTLEDVLDECKTNYNLTSLSLNSSGSPAGENGRKRTLSDDDNDSSTDEEDAKIDSKKAKLELEQYEELD